MENLSHSRQPNSILSKKSCNGTTAGSGGGGKSMYDDVFGGPPRFGAPTLSPRVEDYAEIFGGFHASRATSIPVLDLPLVEEGAQAFFNVQSSGFDYGEVFGGFEYSDFAVSFEELMMMDQSNGRDCSFDSDEAWTPEADDLSEESDHSVKNHHFSKEDFYEPVDDSLEFNISYHKASRSNGDMSNEITHCVPGYTFVVDKNTSLSKTDNDYPYVQASDYGHLNFDLNEEMMMEKHLRKTMSHPANGYAGGSLYGNDVRPHRRYVRNGSLPGETFITISDLSLKTCPSQVPPPSRPPPALDVKKKESAKTTTSCSEENVDNGSPTYFDVEVDASSSAAASAAAMKEAMEKAQVKLKNAKELMERKREGLQSRTRVGSMNERKTKEEKVTKIVDGPSSRKEERVHVTCGGKENGMEFHHLEGRQKVAKTSQITSDSLEGKKHQNVAKRSAVEGNGRESLSSQGSGEIDGAAEWNEATQFFELVTTDRSRKALDQANNENIFVNNASIPQHGKKEKKRAMEELEQNRENGEKTKAVGADDDLGEHEKKLEVSKEAYRREGNNGRSEASTVRHKQKGHEKKAHADHGASRQEENVKYFRMDRQPVETEKKTKADGSHKQESTVKVQLKESKIEVEQTIDHKEKDKHPKEANRSGADERRFGCERDNTEQTQRVTFELEENEKKLKMALEQAENERRLKEAEQQSEKEKKSKESQVQIANEKKQKDTYQRKEEESKLREAFEQKENEKRLKEALEKEESERRLKEALEKEEYERRKREAIEFEENKKRQKEAREREENEKRLKEAREREENEKRLKEAHEREENQRILKKALEKEEHEKRVRAAVQQEENEKRQKENNQRDENENSLNYGGKQEVTEMKGKEVLEREYKSLKKEDLEQQENKKKEGEANAREETEKRDNEGFRKEEIGERIIEGLGKEEVGKALHEACEQEESWQASTESHEGERTKTGFELDETGVISQLTTKWPESRTKVKDALQNVLNQCQLDGNNNLQASHMGDEKLQETEKISHEKTARIPAEPRNNKKEAAADAVNLPPDGKTKVSCEDESLESSREVEHGIAQRNFEKARSVHLPDSHIESQWKKFTDETGERRKFNKQPQVNQKDNRDNFMSAKVVKESIEIGRKTEAAQPATFEVKGSSQNICQQVNRSQSTERKVNNVNGTVSSEEKEPERLKREKELEKDRLRQIQEEMEREREREKDRMAVDRATLEARDRAFVEARDRAERAAVERAMNEARERLEKACAEAREKTLADKMSTEARHRAERAAIERAAAEARERAFGKAMAERTAFEARERVERSVSDKFSAYTRNNVMRPSSSLSDLQDLQSQSSISSGGSRYPYSSVYTERSGVEGESAQRCKARLERHRRTAERAAKALAEKNMRDLLAQREQAERNRLAESLDADVKRWSSGKEGNLRALLSTLQYILGPDSGWQPIPLTEVITSAAVKRAYRKATLCVHPDKLQQRGASIQQKYICEKVFDLLKEAWNKFNSEER